MEFDKTTKIRNEGQQGNRKRGKDSFSQNRRERKEGQKTKDKLAAPEVEQKEAKAVQG